VLPRLIFLDTNVIMPWKTGMISCTPDPLFFFGRFLGFSPLSRLILMWPVDFFDRIGSWLQRQLGRMTKVDRYEFVSGQIVRQRGFFESDVVSVSDIVEWSIYHEMVFDVITIVTNRGTTLRWLDSDNGLINILRQYAGSEIVTES